MLDKNSSLILEQKDFRILKVVYIYFGLNNNAIIYIYYRYKRILVVISHSQDFLNGVCTNIIHMNQKKLKTYGVSIRLFAHIFCFEKGSKSYNRAELNSQGYN